MRQCLWSKLREILQYNELLFIPALHRVCSWNLYTAYMSVFGSSWMYFEWLLCWSHGFYPIDGNSDLQPDGAAKDDWVLMDCGLSPVVLGQRPSEAQTVINTDALSSETFSEPLDLFWPSGGKYSRSQQNPITLLSKMPFFTSCLSLLAVFLLFFKVMLKTLGLLKSHGLHAFRSMCLTH